MSNVKMSDSLSVNLKSMNDFDSNLIKLLEDESSLYLVWCEYPACKEFNIAYIGDNGFFYSEETDKLLPVTKWISLEVEK